MASKANRDVILLPIFPKYANAIFEGKKKVEFRKLNIPQNINYVVVYSTAPTQKIVGYFKVEQITIDSPNKLWNLFKNVAGIEKNLLMEYYSGHEQGIAIHVGEFIKLSTPINLDIIEDELAPPQSFKYLEDEHFNRIKAYL
ncbi:MAG: ASCH domain-containing protein [Candidatus Omnitrophica bacterium]|nr:ASCH domain-containing protein [Candidatus Omnitrophota bacterium]MDE2223156.1 ASCH domain-containing protein [Candidatus Omnitrophota bacterium]